MEQKEASTPAAGQHEKRLVALSSVLAAIFLTLFKLVIGLLTQSLGILSEAIHSGLDLMAAGITLFSVRASDRPPDEGHPYGHGKIENLSALIETLLLLVTCGWIVYEAIQRLFFKQIHIEVTLWSFLVMAVSIVIDITRSRALMKTARKYSSQALEADALHFSTDVWSSAVVILGLFTVLLGQLLSPRYPVLASWFFRADAVAALGVSAIVLFVSYRLGHRTIAMLLDTAPKGIATQLKQMVMQLPGVSAVQRLRVRQSGPALFVDMTLAVSSSKSFEAAHEIAQEAESTIRKIAPQCDVVVHVEPVIENNKSLFERVRSIAAKQGLSIHDLHVNEVQKRLTLEVHAEVPDNMIVSEAHERVSAFEKALLQEFPELVDVVVHIEPEGDSEQRHRVSPYSPAEVHDAINRAAEQFEGIKDCHSLTVLREGNQIQVSFHCTVLPNFPITQAHNLTMQMENHLRESLPRLGRVTIHIEPAGE